MSSYDLSPTQLRRQKREWENLGSIDPLWAILSDDQKKFGQWDLNEFFGTGENEIALILAEAAAMGRPLEYGSAFDFGCGVGRLSRAMKRRFKTCVGVDISDAMVRKARELNPECEFFVNEDNDLRMFKDCQFDFVNTNIVLQHQPTEAAVFNYIGEFLRISKPSGIVVFQMPHFIPFRYRIQPRRRVYRALQTIGVSPKFLYQKLKLNPITMIAIPEEKMRQKIAEMGSVLLKVAPDGHGGPHVESRTYFVSRNPS